jgi:TPR repeat protein
MQQSASAPALSAAGDDALSGLVVERLRANEKDPVAMTELGDLHISGKLGVAKSPELAAELYGKAARLWHPPAQLKFAMLLWNGQGIEKDVLAAIKYFKLAADSGLSGAQYGLGVALWSGQGVAQDVSEAVRLLRLAAEQGHLQAQLNMGMALMSEEEVPTNTNKNSVHPWEEGVRWLQAAAAQGATDAKVQLAVAMMKGRGVAMDLQQALVLLREAAEDGNAEAQNNLGAMYLHGHGIPVDREQGLGFFIMAADQGHGRALFNLGMDCMVQADHEGEPPPTAMQMTSGETTALSKDIDALKQARDYFDRAVRAGVMQGRRLQEHVEARLAQLEQQSGIDSTDDAEPIVDSTAGGEGSSAPKALTGAKPGGALASGSWR